MKKWMCVLVACMVVAGGAFAQSDNHTVTVVIDDIQLIEVTGAPTLTLTTATAGSDLTADTDNSSLLSYSHNQATTQTITVGAVEADVSTNDITLTIDLDGGGDITIVSGGTVSGTTDLEAGIARGAYSNEVLDYGASATLAGSVPYSNQYTVTYTIEDD